MQHKIEKQGWGKGKGRRGLWGRKAEGSQVSSGQITKIVNSLPRLKVVAYFI